MKVVLFSIGTRGDMEPFLAIAELMKEKKWDVLCVFPEQFRETVEKAGHRFEGFTPEFLELLDGPEAKMIMGGGGSWLMRMKFLIRMSQNGMRLQKEIIARQHRVQLEEAPDRIFYHPKCLHAVAWGMVNPGKSIMISPIPCMTHPVKHLTAMGLKGNSNKGQFINLLSYWIVNWIKAVMAYKLGKRYYRDFSKLKITRNGIYQEIIKKVKTFYTISPSLFPRPEYWPQPAQVVGYYERDKAINWQPDEELISFIKEHDKIVFITFGSMSNNNPKEKTQHILEVLKKHRIPAIINTSWGGLEKPQQHPDHVLFVQNLPYDWIFPKMYAVIHHGGSGTTHTTLKYGCASMIIPHIIDQFYWNDTTSNLKLGPKGVPIKKLNRENFEKGIMDLLNNDEYKTNAERVSQQMLVEADRQKLYEMIIN